MVIPALLWGLGFQQYERALSSPQAMWQQCPFKNRSRSTDLRTGVFWLGFWDICSLLELQLPTIYQHQRNEKSLSSTQWKGGCDPTLSCRASTQEGGDPVFQFLLQELFMNFLHWLFLVKCRNCPRRALNPDVSLRPTQLPDYISSFFSGSWRNTMALVLLLVQMWDRCWDASYTPTEESWEMCSDMFRTKRLFHIVILDLDTSYLCFDCEIAVLSLPLFFFLPCAYQYLIRLLWTVSHCKSKT